MNHHEQIDIAVAHTGSHYQFVQLNRTFHELSKDAAKSDDDDFSQAFYVSGQLNWDALFKNYRTVILSEAGSGKTEELRHAARRLRGEGKVAFFLRLEHIPDDLDEAFEVGSIREFNDWLASGDESWLLLDSVDEARLRNPGDFERAIRKLGHRIIGATDRVHIVLTGRTYAWRPKTDLAFCEQHLPFTIRSTTAEDVDPNLDISDLEDDSEEAVHTEQHEDGEAQQAFKIVSLDNLSQEQIKAFASARNVANTQAFLDTIERTDAWSFTSRPQDLEETIEFWHDKGRIGTRLELMQNSVEKRLLERDQARAEARPLSPQRAREGARLIAAASTLAQNPTIQVPDGTENTKGLSLRSVLPNWDDRDQATLLSRPIFDEAIYGTVRFHHRSAREFLAAEWLANLLLRHTSRRSIEDLLFRNQYGMEVIIPTMRPILPWLAILDEKVRERLRKVAPEVVFEGGDPSALPLKTRRTILGEVCEQLAGGSYARSATDYAAVQRFASADLVEDIRSLLKKYGSNDDVLRFLIRMVWLGQLTDLLPEAKALALSRKISRYTRTVAFRAIRTAGTAADQKDVREVFLTESDVLDRDWIGELISEIDPTRESMSWLLAAIAKTEAKERYSTDRLPEAVATFAEGLPLALLPDFLAGLSRLLNQPPFIERRLCEVSERFAWLMRGAAVVVARLLTARDAHALHSDSLGILFKFRLAKEWRGELQTQTIEFGKLLPAWPELNRASLWHDVRAVRDGIIKKGDRLTSYWQASVFGAFWSFSASDFEYALDQIENQREADDKEVALSLAFDLYKNNGRPRAWRDAMKKAVAGNGELADQLSNFLNPRPRNNAYRLQEQRWKRQAATRKKTQNEQNKKSKKYLLEHTDELRNPKFKNPADVSRPQWYLHEKIREKRSDSSRWTEGRWRDLIPEYGEDVAQAYRDGAVAYWRNYKPVLRSEGAASNSIPLRAIFGLTGLDIEANETPHWSATLSAAEVELACRYALYELNGFPSWFPKLFAAHREIVSKIILREIEFELTIEKVGEETHYILSDVSWSGEWAWEQLGGALYAVLERFEPANAANLNKLLKIVQGSGISNANLARLAQSKCMAVPQIPNAAHWFAVWVGAEPSKAIPSLESRLEGLTPPSAQTEFAMSFVTRLSGGRRSESAGARSEYHTAGHLKALYLLMHKYIRQQEDIERANGGVYSPGLRDNAQESRNGLLELLHKIKGKDAFLAMQEIAEAHPTPASRPWFLSMTRERAEQDADFAPWSPAQVREFHERLDRTPDQSPRSR